MAYRRHGDQRLHALSGDKSLLNESFDAGVRALLLVSSALAVQTCAQVPLVEAHVHDDIVYDERVDTRVRRRLSVDLKVVVDASFAEEMESRSK